MSKATVLQDYQAELENALRMQQAGQTEVPANVAGEELAAGRDTVPIAEYVNKWRVGIDAMEAGADQSQFSY